MQKRTRLLSWLYVPQVKAANRLQISHVLANTSRPAELQVLFDRDVFVSAIYATTQIMKIFLHGCKPTKHAMKQHFLNRAKKQQKNSKPI
jgi:hypothetical protein